MYGQSSVAFFTLCSGKCKLSITACDFASNERERSSRAVMVAGCDTTMFRCVLSSCSFNKEILIVHKYLPVY